MRRTYFLTKSAVDPLQMIVDRALKGAMSQVLSITEVKRETKENYSYASSGRYTFFNKNAPSLRTIQSHVQVDQDQDHGHSMEASTFDVFKMLLGGDTMNVKVKLISDAVIFKYK